MEEVRWDDGMAGVPPDSAFGPGLMPTRPTGRGQAGYVRCVPVAEGVQADSGKPTCRGLPPAVCVGDVALPCRQRRGGGSGGSAAGQCLWLRADAYPPHGQGACGLRCVPFAASMRADGGKRMRSGLLLALGTLPCLTGKDGAAVPPGSAFSTGMTPPCFMNRRGVLLDSIFCQAVARLPTDGGVPARDV